MAGILGENKFMDYGKGRKNRKQTNQRKGKNSGGNDSIKTERQGYGGEAFES